MGPNATAYPKRFEKCMVIEEIWRWRCWDKSLICLFSNQKPVPNSWALSELSLRWWKDNSCLLTLISAVRAGGCRSCTRPDPLSQQGKGAWAAGEQRLPHTLWTAGPTNHCSLQLTDTTLLSHSILFTASNQTLQCSSGHPYPIAQKKQTPKFTVTANHHYSLRKKSLDLSCWQYAKLQLILCFS